jgi:hypothetical protein
MGCCGAFYDAAVSRVPQDKAEYVGQCPAILPRRSTSHVATGLGGRITWMNSICVYLYWG